MRETRQFQIRARKPKDVRFGDFTIASINYDDHTATADFGDARPVKIDISVYEPKLREYTRAKTFYIRMI